VVDPNPEDEKEVVPQSSSKKIKDEAPPIEAQSKPKPKSYSKPIGGMSMPGFDPSGVKLRKDASKKEKSRKERW